jgi:hypothetical protein
MESDNILHWQVSLTGFILFVSVLKKSPGLSSLLYAVSEPHDPSTMICNLLDRGYVPKIPDTLARSRIRL